MSRVTQADVASRLNLSRRAVGFALSDDPSAHRQIGSTTRQRIQQAAREMGYQPHRYAQLLRGKKSGVIGMIHFGGLMQLASIRMIHAATAIDQAGYRLLAGDVVWYQQGVRAICEAMIDARVEGVVLCAPSQWFSPAELKRFQRAEIPVVAISGMRIRGVPQVSADVRQGMFDLTQHLIALGHRRLAMLTQQTEGLQTDARWAVSDRVAGFRDALAERPDVRGETFGQDSASESWLDPYEPGARAMTKLLQSQTQRPDAVLCSNDDWAMGALGACADAGIRIPHDMALTGFDNAVFGGYGAVRLTTVAQPTQQMAAKAIDILLRLVREETLSADEMRVKLPCQLVVRESCGSTRNRA